MKELFFAFLVIFWVGLGALPLAEPDEARNGEIVREIVVDNNWFPPTVNGKVRYQKPPLYYWLTALSSKWFSSYEFGVRFWSALSATLLAFLLMVWGGRMWGNGWASALAFASFLVVFVYARIGRMDMLLTLFIAASIYFFWCESYLLGALFLGLAFLTKGPVALVFAASALVPFYLAGGRLEVKKLAGAFLMFLLVVAPVFLLLERSSPGYCKAFFWKENVLRYLTPTFKREKPFYYFVVVLLVGLLPWTPWLLFGFKRRLQALFSVRSDAFMLLGWMFLPVIFFSFSKSKLVHYILPSIPAWALFAGSLSSTVPVRVLRGFAAFYLAAALLFFPWYMSRRSLKELSLSVRSGYPFVPVYVLDERLYGVSLYAGVISPEVKPRLLKGMKGRFWVVGKLRKLDRLNVSGCRALIRRESGKFGAVLMDCSSSEKKNHAKDGSSH